jgi:hypothetical protein
MPLPSFKTTKEFADKADAYFKYIEGEYHMESVPSKDGKQQQTTEQKVTDREPEAATFTGLVLFLGFNSRQAFDDYEHNGRFASELKRARLRVEAAYEKKLHQQSTTGAIFALKSMGWNEKNDDKAPATGTFKGIKIEIVETGPKTAESEKEVVL